MKKLLASLLFVSPTLLAADYRLDPGAAVENGSLKVAPTVEGPAGAALRYEIRTTREGAAGQSSSSQSGSVKLGRDGAAKLATTSISVTPQDRYRISIRVLEAGRVVAQKDLRHPE